MLVMRAIEDPAYPLGKLVCSEEPLRLHDLALGVHPLGLDRVQPRALLRKQATHDPHPAPALFDFSVVFSEPSPHLFGDMPARVVPDEQQRLLSRRLELLAAPRKKPRRYGRNRPSVHEPDPRPIHPWQIEPVAGDGFRLGVVLGDRPLDEAKGLSIGAPGVQSGQSHPAPPALVQEAHRPGLGICAGDFHQAVAPPFFLSYKGSGEVIHRLARIHLTERRRDKVARTVSPETRSVVRPSSKATSAAISKVHRLELRPNSLGERWSISLRASALFSSKSWMASRAVCEAHPRFKAILGARSPRELAKMICDRRKVKVSLERRPALRLRRSSSDNERTKMGVFMDHTVPRQPKPI